jgi:hypothetical protein
MAKWPELELPVLTGIHLDPKNVRLETSDAQVEADILEDLFANEDALGLVDGISKVGYLIHETPIVVKRRGQHVVVEGNRRLAALKAIQNPMLVPKYQARVVALSANIPDVNSLATIRVMVAPNQSLRLGKQPSSEPRSTLDASTLTSNSATRPLMFVISYFEVTL